MTRKLGVLFAALTVFAGLSAPSFAATPHKKKPPVTHAAKPAKTAHKKK